MTRLVHRFRRRTGSPVATARGHVWEARAGVKLEHERLPSTSTDEGASLAAEAKRARGAAGRARPA